jgi:histidine ammonia-lyase
VFSKDIEAAASWLYQIDWTSFVDKCLVRKDEISEQKTW